MHLDTAGEVVQEHLSHNPGLQRAALHDARFAADLHRLRVFLAHMDVALDAEGLGPQTRARVAAQVVADCVGDDEQHAAAQRLREEAGRIIVPADLLSQLSEPPAGGCCRGDRAGG